MPPVQPGQFKTASAPSHKSFYLFLAISNAYLTKALVNQKLQVEERVKEKELARKETSATMDAAKAKMVEAVFGLDKKNKFWAAAQEKRLSGDFYPGIISETEGKFSTVMYHVGRAMRDSEPILNMIMGRNRDCKGFEVASGLSSVEVKGERFSATIIATPSASRLHAFELHYIVEQSGKRIEDSREPLTEANMVWNAVYDLGNRLLAYSKRHFNSI